MLCQSADTINCLSTMGAERGGIVTIHELARLIDLRYFVELDLQIK